MKIALCISGQPRAYKKGYEDLKKYYLDKYDIDNVSVAVTPFSELITKMDIS